MAPQTDLTPSAKQALENAIGELEPHSTHPAIGGVLSKLKGAAGEGEEGEDGALEKAMESIRSTRVALAKSADPALTERLQKAERELQVEYLSRHSGAYRGEPRETLEATMRRESGRGLA